MTNRKKFCARCQYKKRTSYSRLCLKCNVERQHEWTSRNIEKVKTWARRNYSRTRIERLAKIRNRYQTDVAYREYVKQKAREWRKAHPQCKRDRDANSRAVAKRFVQDYLSTHPCVDCGETDIRCLDFDHRDPKKKRYCIGAGWASGILPKSLSKEIAKCDVRCSNCHRKRHASLT